MLFRSLAAVFGGRVPVDPTGTPYEIDTNGRVRLGRTSPLAPLPNEPKRKAMPTS